MNYATFSSAEMSNGSLFLLRELAIVLITKAFSVITLLHRVKNRLTRIFVMDGLGTGNEDCNMSWWLDAHSTRR